MDKELAKNCKISDNKQKVVGWMFRVNQKLNLGHMSAILHVKKMCMSGHKVKILFVDSTYTTKKDNERNTKLYEIYARLFDNIFDSYQVEHVKVSDLRNNKNYVKDFYKIISLTSERDLHVFVKDKTQIRMSDLVTVVCKVLDISKSHADHIITDNMNFVDLGNKLMAAMDKPLFESTVCYTIRDYKSNRMSAEIPDAEINICDTVKGVTKKISKYFCEEGNADNEVMRLFEHVVIPYCETYNKEMIIKTKSAGVFVLKSYEELVQKFNEKLIHPGDLKNCVSEYINEIMTTYLHISDTEKCNILKLLK